MQNPQAGVQPGQQQMLPMGDAPGSQGQMAAPGQQDGNALLQQQQALMAMAGGAPSTGFDAGASREALMNLLTRQGFGGGGMGAAGMAGFQGQQGFGGMTGFQGQQGAFGAFGGLAGAAGGGDQTGAPGTDQAGMMGAIGGPNPAFSGFSPAMGGGFNPALMGGMAGMGGAGMMGAAGAGIGGSVLGSSNLLGAGGPVGAGGAQGTGDNMNKAMMDGSGGMAHQNMLIQQMLQQQAAAANGGSLWQQYGTMPGADGMMGGAAGAGAAGLGPGYLNMLGQGVAGAAGQPREAVDAGVFQAGALPDFAKSGKKSRPKKPKNKPKRPLSAYNIFFKDERAKILADIPDKKSEEEGEEKEEESKEKTEDGEGGEGGEEKTEKDSEEKEESGKKTTGKKRKRVPHGKIGFESLAKIVGQRWKELPPEELDVYKKRAEEDMKRYRKEMEAYVQKQREGLEQSREHLEKLVDEETKKRYFGDATSGV